MGAVLLAGGTQNKRSALPHSRIMIHQPLGGVRGSTKDIEISTQQIVRLKQELNEILARETGQPVEKVAQDTNRDYWFTADEAKAYGMISKTVTGLSKI
ncbi:MAG TPA: ATP-dependent Clp protease proteolytic subunit, partial [bacterium]|nr:ATP-dependent Clp protease proteolytic subunit [bacterium]